MRVIPVDVLWGYTGRVLWLGAEERGGDSVTRSYWFPRLGPSCREEEMRSEAYASKRELVVVSVKVVSCLPASAEYKKVTETKRIYGICSEIGAHFSTTCQAERNGKHLRFENEIIRSTTQFSRLRKFSSERVRRIILVPCFVRAKFSWRDSPRRAKKILRSYGVKKFR